MQEKQEISEGELTPSQEFQAPVVDQSPHNMPVNSRPLSPLVQAVMDGKLTTEQMREMLDIQATFEAMESKKAYNHAMAQFKAHAPTLKKNKTVTYVTDKGTTSYNHVALGYALAEITPILSNFGLSLSWKTTQENGQVIVTAYVTHELGHSETNTLMAAPDSSGGKNGIQSIVSTTTYLKRSTGLSLLGLEGSDDDDGQGSGPRYPVAGNRQPAPQTYSPKYNADQKATFDQILRDEDAIAAYLLSNTIDEGIWTDLYNSGEKGEKMALKTKCNELVKMGHNMVKNIETALGNGDAVLAIENYDCSTTGEGLLRRHLKREGIKNLEDLIKLDD